MSENAHMRIAVLREAGGLGDVVATEPAVRGLRTAFPESEIWYACLPEYRELVGGWPAPPDVFLEVHRHQRRDRDGAADPQRWPYLAAFERFDRVIDLFCPAFRHEKKWRNRTHKSRVRLFCEAAGVPPSRPEQTVPGEKRHWARGWLAAKGHDPEKPLVGLQVFSCGLRRNWPKEKWAALAGRLRERGASVMVFHTFPGAVRGIPGMKATGLRLGEAAALAERCDLLVTPDSGLLHLGVALGVRTLSLWGSTSPHVTCELYAGAEYVWPDRSPARPRECRAPCYSMRDCLAPACMRSCRLLEGLPVDEVLARTLSLLPAGFF